MGSPTVLHQQHLAATSNIGGISTTTTQAGSQVHEPLIGAEEASRFLGFKPITILRMAHRGQLPTVAFPVGSTGKFRHKFKLSQLQALVESLSRPATIAA